MIDFLFYCTVFSAGMFVMGLARYLHEIGTVITNLRALRNCGVVAIAGICVAVSLIAIAPTRSLAENVASNKQDRETVRITVLRKTAPGQTTLYKVASR